MNTELKPPTQGHPVVSREEWIAARQALLAEEKALTRSSDRVSQLRRELPWVRLEKEYAFEGPNGRETLADLFGGRSQLIVYHFMFAPGWEEGCTGCSFLADHIDGANQHLAHHDVSVVVVSRAPVAELMPFKRRMGWQFKWVSSGGSDFNYDFHASYTREQLDAGDVFHNFAHQRLQGEDQPGTSVFYRAEDGTIYHTYSSYERGGDALIGAHNWLDLTPKGRNESETMDWVRLHDQYGCPEETSQVQMTPRFVDAPPLLIAGLDRHYRVEQMGEIPGQWMEFAPSIGSLPGQIGYVTYGVSTGLFAHDESFRYMAGVEVSDLTGLPDVFSAVRLPAQRYAVFTHGGHVSKFCEMIDAIFRHWLPSSGYQPTVAPAFFERYDETFDPVSGLGGMEVWVPIHD